MNNCQQTEETKKLFPGAVKVLIFTLLLWTWQHFNMSATYGAQLDNKDVGEKGSSMKGARCLKGTETLFPDYYEFSGKRGSSYFCPNDSDSVQGSQYFCPGLSKGQNKDYYEMTKSDAGDSSVSYQESTNDLFYNDNYEDLVEYNGIDVCNYGQSQHGRSRLSRSIRRIRNFLRKMDKCFEKQLKRVMWYEEESIRNIRGRMSGMARMKVFLLEKNIMSPAIISAVVSLICATVGHTMISIIFAMITNVILIYIILKILKMGLNATTLLKCSREGAYFV
ncbi:hypothetical protein AK88_04715 [Plasmodium fragile]|uniref:Pv-fam-d protein n=1 Tax=Plasmodium fragile TaxID=5857 RepID=A0A0D9QF89_PLAFR|nr:uncharacterized protein AK88_04715 [Plasmodium fragile]KJP85643.1 hypothetical protein AK88_04715 [Plasmodium fragile]